MMTMMVVVMVVLHGDDNDGSSGVDDCSPW